MTIDNALNNASVNKQVAKEQAEYDLDLPNANVVMVADESKDSSDFKISQIKRLTTEQLFSNVKEVMIEHRNETYILRITKQNKLILTK
jgi:hemin uptake protein HemP